MANGVDIKSLKKEIDSRKKQLSERKNALGETVEVPVTGDKFLAELLHSTKTGVETSASLKVKNVDKLAEAKINKTPVDPSLLQHIPASTPTPSINENVSPKPVMSAAEIARYNEQERIKKEGLNPIVNTSNAGIADAMSQYINTPQVGAPMQNNNMLTEQQMMARLAGGTTAGVPNQIITEQVTDVATKLLNENFGKLYAEAMKNSIIETYKAEVVKASLEENKAIIKEIVVETILELQKRNQSKKK